MLIGVFGFAALHAVILNKAMSLVVVITALPARLLALPYTEIATHWSIAVNLLTGSLAGAWLGASWAICGSFASARPQPAPSSPSSRSLLFDWRRWAVIAVAKRSGPASTSSMPLACSRRKIRSMMAQLSLGGKANGVQLQRGPNCGPPKFGQNGGLI